MDLGGVILKSFMGHKSSPLTGWRVLAGSLFLALPLWMASNGTSLAKSPKQAKEPKQVKEPKESEEAKEAKELKGTQKSSKSATDEDEEQEETESSEKKAAAKSYEKCRKDLIKKLKLGTVNKSKFTHGLNSCRENFPSSGVYAACKKQTLKKLDKNQKQNPEALQRCQNLLKSIDFSPDNPAPFVLEQGQLFFAGIGLNRSQSNNLLTPPNFDCIRLNNATKSTANAQYLLFGNHPSSFKGFRNKNREAILSALGDGLKPPQAVESKKSSKKKGKIHDRDTSAASGLDYIGFGRIFEKPTSPKALAFFPMAACDFKSDTGPHIGALSAYYLLDTVASNVTPIFGITYFKEKQDKFSTADVIDALKERLGDGYKDFKKNQQTSFVAMAATSDTDDEGDPKNLCQEPRLHKFLGIVQGQKDNAAKPDYVLLASIKNLCDFGDRMSIRLVK